LNVVLQQELNKYFAGLISNPSGVRTLADLIKFNDANPTLEEPQGFSDQSTFVSSTSISIEFHELTQYRYSLIESDATPGLDAAYFAALAADHELGRARGIDGALKAHNLDALVLPSDGFTTSPAGMYPSPPSLYSLTHETFVY